MGSHRFQAILKERDGEAARIRLTLDCQRGGDAGRLPGDKASRHHAHRAVEVTVGADAAAGYQEVL